MGSRLESRRNLIRAVVQLLVDHPFEHLSLQAVADRCGVSLWALRYAFENVDGLFRAAGLHLIETVHAETTYQATDSPSVVEAIHHYAEFVAQLVSGDDYRNLLYFVVRNGRHHPWLVSAYERRVAAPIADRLKQVILDAGRRHGATILLRDEAARRFLKRIETELALCELLPTGSTPAPEDCARALRDIVRETFAATYLFEWDAASAA